MKKMKNIWRNLCVSVNLPEEAMVEDSLIEIVGDHKIKIDGVDDILEYDEHGIRLSVRNKQLKVEGENLFIEMYMGRNVVIYGEILSVRFE